MANEQNQPQSGVSPELRHERSESRKSSTYKAFLGDVCRLGNLDEAKAEAASVAVLCALQQRVLADESDDLAAQLPDKLVDLLQSCALHEGQAPRRFGREEFFRMVAGDLDMEAGQVEPLIRTVIAAVRAQVSEGQAEDFGGMLPPDIRDLWQRPI